MRDMSSLTSEGVLKVFNKLMTECNSALIIAKNELKIKHNELKIENDELEIENDELMTEKNETYSHEKCLSSCFSCDG